MADEQVTEILKRHDMPAKTTQTITDEEALFNQIDEIQDQEYALDDEENIEGLRCVAMPVTGADGEIVRV